jgi:hypothetical protein
MQSRNANRLIATFGIEKIRFGEMTRQMKRYVPLYAKVIQTPTKKAIQFVSNSVCSLD